MVEKKERLLKSQREFGLSLTKTLRKTRSKLKPPAVVSQPVFAASYELGFDTAAEGDSYSGNRSELGTTVVSGISLVQEELGRLANEALAETTRKVKNKESDVRSKTAGLHPVLIWAIIAATVIIDSVAAHSALNLAFKKSDTVTWVASIGIAVLLAITGWIIAVASVKLLGSSALWVGLILSFVAVVGLGFVTAELRGKTAEAQAAASALNQVNGTSFENPEDKEAAVAEAQETKIAADNKLATYNIWFYGTLILFTVSVASLAKAYETSQKNEVFDKRTVSRQNQRGRDVASAFGYVSTLDGWLVSSQSVQELGNMALARYLDGYRSGLSPEQLDYFSANPPKLAVLPTPSWTAQFEQRSQSLEADLRSYDGDLSLPATR
jgi:hypothetical protein